MASSNFNKNIYKIKRLKKIGSFLYSKDTSIGTMLNKYPLTKDSLDAFAKNNMLITVIVIYFYSIIGSCHQDFMSCSVMADMSGPSKRTFIGKEVCSSCIQRFYKSKEYASLIMTGSVTGMAKMLRDNTTNDNATGYNSTDNDGFKEHLKTWDWLYLSQVSDHGPSRNNGFSQMGNYLPWKTVAGRNNAKCQWKPNMWKKTKPNWKYICRYYKHYY